MTSSGGSTVTSTLIRPAVDRLASLAHVVAAAVEAARAVESAGGDATRRRALAEFSARTDAA
jgi:hypothetical protein